MTFTSRFLEKETFYNFTATINGISFGFVAVLV